MDEPAPDEVAYRAVRDAFLRARDAREEERAELLDRWRTSDPGLAAVVERMLRQREPSIDHMPGAPLPAIATLLEEVEREAALGESDPAQLPEVNDRYRIVERLGAGGTGEVYRAQQLEPVRREVAIKIFRADGSAEVDSHRARRAAARRFEREARVLARLEHPGIARILDVGVTADGRRFLAMELVVGASIVQACRERDAPFEERIALVLQACDAVEHAHGRGVIHRDLKPSNLLMTRGDRPRVKVIDFGIAGLLDAEDPLESRITADGQVLGTVAYMSPEQLTGQSGDVRSDVYALGAMLHELIAGRRLAVARRVPGAVGDERIDLSGAACAASRRRRDLEAVVDRATAGDPAQRYPSIAAFAADLRALLDDRPIAARPAGTLRRTLLAARRAPVAASAIVVACLLGLLAFVSITVSRQRLLAEQRRERAEVARLLDDVLVRLYPLVGATEPRRTLTTLLLDRVGALLELAPEDLELRLARARLEKELGNIATELGDFETAARQRDEVYAQLERLAAAHPEDPDVVRLFADALVRRGDTWKELEQRSAAADAYRRAFEELSRAHRQWPDHLALADDLAWAYDRLYTEEELIAEPDRILPLIDERRALAERLVAMSPHRSLSHFARLEGERRMALAFGLLGCPDEALEHGLAAIAIGFELVRREPARLHYRIQVAYALLNTADVARQAERFALEASLRDDADRMTAEIIQLEPERIEGLELRLRERMQRLRAEPKDAADFATIEAWREIHALVDRLDRLSAGRSRAAATVRNWFSFQRSPLPSGQ